VLGSLVYHGSSTGDLAQRSSTMRSSTATMRYLLGRGPGRCAICGGRRRGHFSACFSINALEIGSSPMHMNARSMRSQPGGNRFMAGLT
jgi:hypothetical protein